MLFIVGGFTITTGIIERSKRFGFSIVFLTTFFRVYETINFKMEGNTLLRTKQYNHATADTIGKYIIMNKIENQNLVLAMLRDSEIKDDIDLLKKYLEKLKTSALNAHEIMGIEGVASKVYFSKIFRELNWTGRQPRVKRDKINLLLDIGYTLLFNYIEAVANIYGFDIYKGNLHKEFYKRKSFICDMIEPFRPIIDYKIRKLFTLKQCNNWNFVITNGRHQLSYKDSSECVTILLKEILCYKESIFDYIQQYYRWFMKNGDIENFPKGVLIKNDLH
jgi:CRISPR-associated protein Cas1